MYPHFVEVHPKNCETESGWTDSGVLVNIDHIVEVGEQYVNTTDMLFTVRETYEELKQLISDAGCCIQKADPRLDTSKPLTMEDLKGMIGEPVWDANSGRWYLVYEIVPDDYRDDVVSLRTSDGGCWYYDVSDLIAKPLYRMKRE